MAQQTKNLITVKGIVDSVERRTGVTKTNVPYVSGRVVVDCGDGNKVPVEFFSTELKKDGTPNGICNGIKTFLDECKSIVDDGIDNATLVDFSRAEVRENFWSPDGISLLDGFRISTSFLNRAKTKLSEKDYGAKFILEGIFLGVADEVKNDVPTGDGIVTFATVGYNDKLDIFKLRVSAPDGLTYIKNNLNVGDKTTLGGKVVYIQETEIITKPAAFGDPIEEVKTKTTRDLVIESITPVVESNITPEEFNKMKQEREALRAEALSAAKAKAAEKPKTPTSAADFSI